METWSRADWVVVKYSFFVSINTDSEYGHLCIWVLNKFTVMVFTLVCHETIVLHGYLRSLTCWILTLASRCVWTDPQQPIMIIYISTWSILIQKIRIILSGDNLTLKHKRKTPSQSFTRPKKIYRFGRSLKYCGNVHLAETTWLLIEKCSHRHPPALCFCAILVIFKMSP